MKIYFFLIVIAALARPCMAQEKLVVNEKSAHPVDWQYKTQFIGTTDDFAFYLSTDKSSLSYFKIDKDGNISKRVPITLSETDNLKSAALSDFLILDGNPVVIFKAYSKSAGEWRTYIHPLNDDGVLEDKNATILDKTKQGQALPYSTPNTYVNKDRNQFLVNNDNTLSYLNYNSFTANVYDADLQPSAKKTFSFELAGKKIYQVVSTMIESDKVVQVVHTTGKLKGYSSYISGVEDVDDYILTCDLVTGKAKVEKIPLTDRKVVTSVLHLKDKIVYTGVTLQDKHNYAQKQFIAQYDLLSGKITAKQFDIPASGFEKINIKPDKQVKLEYATDFYVSSEVSAERDNGNYLIVLKLHKLKNGVDDKSISELVLTDSTLTNIKTKIVDIYSGLTGFIISETKLITFSIDKDKTDKSKNALTETEISNEGLVTDNVVYTWDWHDMVPYRDAYGNMNIGVIKNQDVIFELKHGDDGVFGTLDISK